jgi:hypothetical protein
MDDFWLAQKYFDAFIDLPRKQASSAQLMVLYILAGFRSTAAFQNGLTGFPVRLPFFCKGSWPFYRIFRSTHNIEFGIVHIQGNIEGVT